MWDFRKVFWSFLTNRKNFMQRNSIQYMVIIEISIKRKETDYINNNLNILPINEELSKLELKKTQMDFDATSLYPSAMRDENSVYPKIESGFWFKLDINVVHVEELNNRTFNQDGNEFAILRMK